MSTYDLAYNQDHRQERAAKSRAQRAAHPEVGANYRATHKGDINAKARARYASHKAEEAIRYKTYYEAHKAEIAARMVSYHLTHKVERATYRAEHKETIAARVGAYNKTHPEQMATSDRTWREAHKPKLAASGRAYKQDHAAEIAIRQRAYYLAHPDKISAHRHRRRARMAGAEHVPYNPSDIFARDLGVCGLCHERVATKAEQSIDHILPISLGGADSPHNVQLAHRRCNFAKSNSALQFPQNLRLAL